MIVDMRFKAFSVRLSRHDLDLFLIGLMEAFGIGVTIQDTGNHTIVVGLDGAREIRIVKGDLAVVGRHSNRSDKNRLKRLKLEAFYTNNREGL